MLDLLQITVVALHVLLGSLARLAREGIFTPPLVGPSFVWTIITFYCELLAEPRLDTSINYDVEALNYEK